MELNVRSRVRVSHSIVKLLDRFPSLVTSHATAGEHAVRGLTINHTGLHQTAPVHKGPHRTLYWTTPDPTVPAPDPTEPGHIEL